MQPENSQLVFQLLGGLISTLFMLFFLTIFAVSIGLTVFWILMIVDCVKHEPSTGNDKIMWILILLLTHGIGALIYYFMRRAPRLKLLNQRDAGANLNEVPPPKI